MSVASLTRALETLTGELVFKGAALEDLSPLLLTPVAGTLDATARISGNQNGLQVSLTASGRNVAYQDNRIGTLAINGEVLISSPCRRRAARWKPARSWPGQPLPRASPCRRKAMARARASTWIPVFRAPMACPPPAA
ncbi:hypothetical protein V6L77_19645 [Pannonibacter sp. Pt2-lr]